MGYFQLKSKKGMTEKRPHLTGRKTRKQFGRIDQHPQHYSFLKQVRGLGISVWNCLRHLLATLVTSLGAPQ
jgi:hypothetical protein